jgi:predicted alpha/beta hydrolase family esterase
VTLQDVTVVIVPGLREHVAEHWQTLLVRRLPRSRTVEPLAHDKLSRAARVAALDATLAQVDGPVVLAAHSAGVMIVAHWARQHRRGGIAGALLATPADLEEPMPANYPTTTELREHGWLPFPRDPLSFPSIVGASRSDPLARFERVAGFAADWGASLADLGDVGHLNPAAGYGEWPQALDLLAQLMQPLETTS